MATKTAVFKQVVYRHLLANAGVQALVADRIYGHHFNDEEAGSAVHPLVVIELNAGGAAYDGVVEAVSVDIYAASKVGSGEAAEVYDAVRDALQAERVFDDTLDVHYLAQESERPIEAQNPRTKAWLMRGSWTFTGVQ